MSHPFKNHRVLLVYDPVMFDDVIRARNIETNHYHRCELSQLQYMPEIIFNVDDVKVQVFRINPRLEDIIIEF